MFNENEIKKYLLIYFNLNKLTYEYATLKGEECGDYIIQILKKYGDPKDILNNKSTRYNINYVENIPLKPAIDLLYMYRFNDSTGCYDISYESEQDEIEYEL